MIANGQQLPPDLAQIIENALDIAYYRSIPDDAGLAAATWFELRSAVTRLPEAPPPEPPPRPRYFGSFGSFFRGAR